MYTMSMRLRDKFRLLAVGLLLALTTALAVAAAVWAPPAEAAFSQAPSDIPFAPEHAACLKPHHPCGPGGVAPAPVLPVALDAATTAALVKAPPLLPAPIDGVAPHPAASLFILFRNLRE